MTGKVTLESLRNIGADQGARLRRALAVAAVPVAAGLTTACYAAPSPEMFMDEEVCVDGFDNDADGQTDCLDAECSGYEVCTGCLDGLDNDADGLSDCSDASCANSEACTGACDDGVDDDGDGFADCVDLDCTGSPSCP